MATTEGLEPEFRLRVEAMLADPEAHRLGLYLLSGYRDPAKQRRLWDEELAKQRRRHHDWSQAQVEHEAAKWVARPGTSNHERGKAADLASPKFKADANGDWPSPYEEQVNELAARHGLRSTLNWEDWHFELDPAWQPPAPAPPQEDDMRPIAGTPSWCKRNPNGTFPRFQATADDQGHAVVVSIDHAPFSPPWTDGASNPGFEDFEFLDLWWRRFLNAGQPYGFGEAEGAFVLLAEHGTYDVAAKP